MSVYVCACVCVCVNRTSSRYIVPVTGNVIQELHVSL